MGRKQNAIICIALLLSGCAAMGGVPTQEIIAETIDTIETTNTTTFENIPPWVMAVCIIGWMAPTPTQIISGSLGYVASAGGFILKLFGR